MNNFYKLLFFVTLLFPVIDTAGTGFISLYKTAIAPLIINGPSSVCSGETAQLSVTYRGAGTNQMV